MSILSSDAFRHVDPEVLEKFLELIKDKYLIVDKANFFLEDSGFSGVNIAILNQRDFLSHLCTVLREETLDRDGQMAQLSAAEEHLRRAIIESYQRAVDTKLLSFSETYGEYKLHGIMRNFSPETRAIREEIRGKLKEVKTLREGARAAKSRNKWDEEWEAGVSALYEAFGKIDDLQSLLDAYFDTKKFKLIKKWKLIAGVSIAVAVVLIIMLFSRLF